MVTSNTTAFETKSTFSPKLLFTSQGFSSKGPLFRDLRCSIPNGWARPTGHGGILFLEAEGDILAIAEHVYQECSEHLGRLVAVFAEVLAHGHSQEPAVSGATKTALVARRRSRTAGSYNY